MTNLKNCFQDLTLICSILRNWYPNEFESHPEIDILAATFLRDLYVQPDLIADHRTKTIAIVCMSMAFSAAHLANISDNDWAPIFQKSIDVRKIVKIKEKILKNLYQVSSNRW